MSRQASGSNDEGASGPPFSLRKSGHDLRNALNIIRNAGYLLKRKLNAAGGENVDLVDMIEDSVMTAEGIAAKMMEEATRRGEAPASGCGGPAK